MGTETAAKVGRKREREREGREREREERSWRSEKGEKRAARPMPDLHDRTGAGGDGQAKGREARERRRCAGTTDSGENETRKKTERKLSVAGKGAAECSGVAEALIAGEGKSACLERAT